MREQRPPIGDRPFRRRPPCRNFGGDARSQELAAQIVERSSRISALLREQLADIAEFDEAESWRGDGAVSMTATGPRPFAIQPFSNADPIRPAPTRRMAGGISFFALCGGI